MRDDVPLRVHVSRLDEGGAPAWSRPMDARMERIKGPDWWRFAPITDWLTQNGYAFGLRVVRDLHEPPYVGIPVICRMERCSRQKVRRHYELCWNAAYEQFHEQYPGVVRKRFHEEMWKEDEG